jgi:hypothetical protein
MACAKIYQRICAVAAMTFFASSMIARAAGLESIDVEGTQFVARLGDGRVLRSAELVGATLTIAAHGGALRLRIDAVEPDPTVPSGEVLLHTLSYQTSDGEWRNLCDAGPDGRRQGFPLKGRARADATLEPAEAGVFELTCTGGAQGKCVRFGYAPWGKTKNGADMLPFYNACVRLVRADYSGDGRGTTRNGQRIDIYDDIGVQQKADDPKDVFEAGFTPAGAVCVNHARVAENVDLAALEKSAPRLAGRVGELCTEEFARRNGAVLFVRSPK